MKMLKEERELRDIVVPAFKILNGRKINQKTVDKAITDFRRACYEQKKSDRKAMKEARFVIHDLLCIDNDPRGCMNACKMLTAAIRRGK